jgi:hypothetical protein
MIIEDFDGLQMDNEFSNARGNRGRGRGFSRGRGRGLGQKAKKPAGYIPPVAAYRAAVKAVKKRKSRRSGFDGDQLDNTDFNMNY